MTAMLFVYGTLMSTVRSRLGTVQRSRLAREGMIIGPAYLQGRLYDLAHYPGAVEAADPAARVHGEVIELTNPAATWSWLDAYEGIAPGNPDPEYARRICPVTRADGQETRAWVYLYRWAVHRGRLIESGRWPG